MNLSNLSRPQIIELLNSFNNPNNLIKFLHTEFINKGKSLEVTTVVITSIIDNGLLYSVVEDVLKTYSLLNNIVINAIYYKGRLVKYF